MGFCNGCQVGPTGRVTLCAPCGNRMVAEQRRVIDRLTFLHDQDHKLADRWQAERDQMEQRAILAEREWDSWRHTAERNQRDCDQQHTGHEELIKAARQWAAPAHHKCIPGIDPICPTCEQLDAAVDALAAKS